MMKKRISIRRVKERARARERVVVVVGAGGNIGSHAVPLICRMPEVEQLILVDGDRYETKNLGSQAILPSEVGQFKAKVQARRAQRLNPALKVVSMAHWVESVPLGSLRCDVMLACLDSRRARQTVNEIAWRLGVAWIDAGVEPSGWLARVNVYLPSKGQPCLECAWDQRDYAQLSTRHPCQLADPGEPPTNAPACLGALAAALQAIECQKLLAGQTRTSAIGRELILEASTDRQYLTSLRRNPNCRFDHRTWQIRSLKADPHTLTLGKALRLGRGNGVATLAFAGQPVVEQLSCPSCGLVRKLIRLANRVRPADRRCVRCDRPLLSSGSHMRTSYNSKALRPHDAQRSLASLGLRMGDVFSVHRQGQEQHYELNAPAK